MGQAFGLENIDDQTFQEVSELQRQAGERWGNREIAAYRVDKLIGRQQAERQADYAKKIRPVEMTSKADTKWARSLGNLKDSQATRTQKRIYDASQEAKDIEENIKKWDKQTAEVLEGSKWGS